MYVIQCTEGEYDCLTLSAVLQEQQAKLHVCGQYGDNVNHLLLKCPCLLRKLVKGQLEMARIAHDKFNRYTVIAMTKFEIDGL